MLERSLPSDLGGLGDSPKEAWGSPGKTQFARVIVTMICNSKIEEEVEITSAWQQVSSYLRVVSCKRGSSRAAESSFKPESPGWLLLRSSSLKWQGLLLRAEARAAHPSSLTRQPDRLPTHGESKQIATHYWVLFHWTLRVFWILVLIVNRHLVWDIDQ